MKLRTNEPLAPYTTLGIGGPALYVAEATTLEEMKEVLLFCQNNSLDFIILGKGSNVLFDDCGYHGCVIINKISFIEDLTGGIFHAGAGYSFSLLGTQTARNGWSGLEFASGIPCTVGGAIYMNAGANGKETADALISVDFIDEFGAFHLINREEIAFGYRMSGFQKQKGAIVGGTFRLTRGEGARAKQIQIIDYRKRTQPYHEKSAGCAFRNPPTDFAGALIEKCGLKGAKSGGAEVSAMHGNFIINSGGATSRDVLTLMEMIRLEVKRVAGVDLEKEINYIPYGKARNL